MADNSLKTPYLYAANQFAATRTKAMQTLLGKGLPCKVVAVGPGPTVTVSFQVNSIFNIPNITMPVQTSEYIRLPTQVGDLGRATPTTAPVAAISGFGTGTPNLGPPGNLTTLVFEPVSNKGWSTVDPNALTLYGPNGAVLRDSGSKTVFTLTPTGVTLALQSGDSLAVTGDITASGEITAGFGGAGSVTLLNHEHPTAVSGPPSPPTPGT